jgi:hypothetical protein
MRKGEGEEKVPGSLEGMREMACNGQKALLPRAKTQGILREPMMTDEKNAEDPFATSPETIVAMLHRELEHALKRVSAYIKKFGPIEEGEDEASSYGAIALGEEIR